MTDLLPYILIITLAIITCLIVFMPRGRESETKKSQIYSTLKKINDEIESNPNANARDIVIRLDSLLSKSLQIKYRNNDSCGQNLKLAKPLFSNVVYNDLWKAHKLRNQIVHDDIEVSLSDTRHSFSVYKKGIFKILS